MNIHIIAAAMGAAVSAGSPATASWADIIISHNKGTSGTSSATVTFSGGGERELEVTHSLAVGTLQVKVGAADYVFLDSGDTFMVSTGTTVIFKFTCFFDDDSSTIDVYDNTAAGTVTSFECSFTYTG